MGATTRRIGSALATIALALITVHTAGADEVASPWSMPQTVPGTPQGLAYSADGSGLLLVQSPTVGDPAAGIPRYRGTLQAVAIGGSGALTPGRSLAPAGYGTQYTTSNPLTTYGRNRFVISGSWEGNAKASGTLWRGAMASPSGPLRMTTIPHTGSYGFISTAHVGDRLATLTVACIRDVRQSGCRPDQLRIAIGRPGERPRSRRLDRGRLRSQAALASNGRSLLAVYSKRDSKGRSIVYALPISRDGRPGRRQELGFTGYSGAVTAALRRDGSAVVGWLSQSVSECDPSATAVTVAVAEPGGRRWRPRTQLTNWSGATCGQYVSGSMIVARAASALPGEPVRIAYTRRTTGSDGIFSIMTTTVTGTRVGAPVTVSDPALQTTLRGFDVGPYGEAIVLGAEGQAGTDSVGTLRLATWTTGAIDRPFGAAEHPNGPAVTNDVQIPYAMTAIDPVTHRAAVAWSGLASAPVTGVALRAPLR